MKNVLTLEETANAIGVEKKTLQEMVRKGLFPRSFPTSPGKRVWLAKDVEAFLHLRSRMGADEPKTVGGEEVESDGAE